MAYIPYPQAPNNPNGFQVLGQALTQGAGQIDAYEDRQAKLRALMEEMTQKRAAALLAKQEAELKAKQLEQEMNLKAEADKRAEKYADEATKGRAISPTLARDPSLSRRGPVAGQPSDELADLENVRGMDPFAQSVTSGGDATSMMGEALDRMPTPAGDNRVPYDRRELADLGLQYRQLDLKDYMAATKPERSPLDRIQVHQLGTKKYLVDLDTGEKTYLGEAEPFHQRQPQFNPQTAASQKFAQENTFRDEYNKKTEKFDTAMPAFGKLQQALARNNPTDAYAAVINFVRTLDPGSTVREAEEKLARMRSAGGTWGSFAQNFFNIVDGKMTDEVRKNLYEAGKGLLEQEHDLYTNVRNDYRDMTLNAPDPTMQGGSLDTLQTIGRGRDPQYNEMIGRDIFSPAPVAPRPAPVSPAIPAKGNRKALDAATAGDYLKRAGGDRKKAKAMLAKDGYNING